MIQLPVWAVWAALGTVFLLCAACLILLLLLHSRSVSAGQLSKQTQLLTGEIRAIRAEITADQQQALRTTAEHLLQLQQQTSAAQDQRLRGMQATLSDQFGLISGRLDSANRLNEQKLENIRQTMETRLSALQAENTQALEQMRQTVDEKLQKTLEEKLQRSFAAVSTQLEQVYRGLGEMQTLATGVGDLKKVLSNVKTRGILGEIQLGNILEEILTPEQYERNIITRPGRRDPVEFAIRLPGDGDTPVYLPIDAKFPLDLYARLCDAYDSGDAEAIELAGRELDQRIRTCAKDIHDKYVEPPYTTEFAILFLPTEGLYAEVMRRGMVERLQREYKINVAGPSTMAAMLNSLQMGFQTLAIQKRSSEVWQVLAAVKTEFNTFTQALLHAQSRIRQADSELETLLGVRTRQMQRKLRSVQTLDGDDTAPPEAEEELPSAAFRLPQ